MLHFIVLILLLMLQTDAIGQEIPTEPEKNYLEEVKEALQNFQKPAIEDPRLKGIEPAPEKLEDLLSNGEEDGDHANGKLFYFFSFSQPESSLMQAAFQAEKASAVLVVRGIKKEESFRDLALKIVKLIENGENPRNVEVWTHPILFRCFKIDSVPQIVLATGKQDEEGCSEHYLKVKGDVSLEFALNLMTKETPLAKEYLKLIQGNSFYDQKN